MKILALSDLHNEFRRIPAKDYPEWVFAGADVVVLAGDIGTGTDGLVWARTIWPHQAIVYVAGNHEHYGRLYANNLSTMRNVAHTLSIHFLENDAVIINDVRFLGCTLWSDFAINGDQEESMRTCGYAMNDYHRIFQAQVGSPWQPRLHKPISPQVSLEWHRASRDWLASQLKEPAASQADEWRETVVVTHHLPHPNSVHAQYKTHRLLGAFCSDLSHLMGQARLWIHGHAHDSSDYEVSGTRVVCNPLGYWPSALNQAFEKAKLIEV